MPIATRTAHRHTPFHSRSLRKRLTLFTAALLITLTGFIPLILSQQTTNAAVGDWDWRERTSAGSRMWSSIASSADGNTLLATTFDSGLWRSTNAGATWTQITNMNLPAGNIMANVAINSDATTIVVSDMGDFETVGGYIYISHDSGATWTTMTDLGQRMWGNLGELLITNVAISDDGQKIAVLDSSGADFEGGYIYTSADGGATWIEQIAAGSRLWASITSTVDGNILFAAVLSGSLWRSTDSGATWQERASAGSRVWTSITSSADGTKIAATAIHGYIYTSTDSGATWQERTSAGSRGWYSITSSADGTKLAAVSSDMFSSDGYLYTSQDSGATWTEQTAAGSRTWVSITSSSDGTKLAAADYDNYIYTGVQQQPALTIDGTVVSTTNPGSQPTKTISNLPTFTGTGYANGPVTVTVNSDPIVCTTIADSNGNWSCTLPSSIPPGNHTVTIVLTNPDNDTVMTIGPYNVEVLGDSTTTIDNNTPLPPNTGLAGLNPVSFPFLIAGFSFILAAALVGFGARK